MNSHRFLKLRIVAVILFTTALLIPVHSFSASAALPAIPGGPKFQMVNAHQFIPYRPETTTYVWNDELVNPGSEDNFNQAALSLPDHIKINKMVVYFYDNNPDKGFCAALWRFDPATGDHLALAELCTIDGDALDQYRTAVDTSIVEPWVDQQRYSYYLEVFVQPAGDTVRIGAVRIDYRGY